MLTFTVLGSGTSVPSRRMAPAHLVRAGDVTLLIDAGSGSTTSLFRAGVTLDRLSGVALTHLHPDHSADLVPLLFALVNPAHPARGVDLPIWGPDGVAAYIEGLDWVHGRWVQPSCSLRVEELLDRQRFEVGPLCCTAFAVEHSAGSVAYRIEGPGGSVCFSGDSGVCLGLVEAARGVDLFVCECSVLEGQEVSNHLSAAQVGDIAAAAACRRVVLTHVYDHVLRADPLRRVREVFDGPVQIAEDGMVLEVG